MPRPEADNSPPGLLDGSRFPGELNGPQQNRLRITCQYIDKLLSEIEHILRQTAGQSPFPRYVIDVAPAQVRVIEDYIRRLRRQLLQALEWQHLRPNAPELPATRAALTNLAFIDIAVEELRPGYMRGSGAVPQDAVDELNGVVHELRSLLHGMERYLRQELTANLASRLQKLEETGCDVALLRTTEQIITRQGLVEFRPRIAALAARMEDNNLEVALFGRVSSGKSSLLNALLDTNVLPVGVIPITAVPTRLRYGSALRAAVAWFDGRNEVVAIDQLAALVTEEGNPGNLRNVARAMIEVPSLRLRQGIVLVDTPGLGSLARKSGAETLAYLPNCDLALLLIDAGTTLHDEDIGTLRLLYEAGIPSLVLLSKSDLLAEGDLHRAIAYVEEQVHIELGLTIHVHAVSSLPPSSALLDRFFEQELLPRFEQAKILRDASVARKIGALRNSVLAAVETTTDQEARTHSHPVPDGVEKRLRLITGEIGELGTTLDHAFLAFGESQDSIVDAVARQSVTWIRTNAGQPPEPLQISEWIHDAVQTFLNQQLGKLHAAMERAVSALQETAADLERAETPSADDFENLLRDVPRFELAALPAGMRTGRGKWLGDRALRSSIAGRLRRSMGPMLRSELHLYADSLRQWSELAIRKTVALVNSYADAHRAQIQRMRGLGEGETDVTEVSADVRLLREWDTEKDVGVAVRRA